ncbi:MAG: DNA polymerase subunit beta [Coleofasciculaceae cyanobacterium SM2_1_6]|nr:DNA polymerase subunit beta [Coleofasciculaceae cyanobacterium SM2_1_6]
MLSQPSYESPKSLVISIPEIYQRLNTTAEEIANFCTKWHIAELALFGSVLRDDFRVAGENPSDIDFLFSYLPETNMSLLRRAAMKIELEHLVQRRVDLVLAIEVLESRNPIRRQHILESTKVIYVQG